MTVPIGLLVLVAIFAASWLLGHLMGWPDPDGALKVNVLGPALALLQSYSFTMRAVVWR